MIAVVQFFGSWLSRVRVYRIGRLREPPIMLAEVIAASSFLDFGGVPDARYFHTLYDWRLSEAERCSTSDSSREGRRCHRNPLRCPKRNFPRRL